MTKKVNMQADHQIIAAFVNLLFSADLRRELTTLEVKDIIRSFGFYADQKDVSDFFKSQIDNGSLKYRMDKSDQFRLYSVSNDQMLQLIERILDALDLDVFDMSLRIDIKNELKDLLSDIGIDSSDATVILEAVKNQSSIELGALLGGIQDLGIKILDKNDTIADPISRVTGGSALSIDATYQSLKDNDSYKDMWFTYSKNSKNYAIYKLNVDYGDKTRDRVRSTYAKEISANRDNVRARKL